jgi:hypothetical protein
MAGIKNNITLKLYKLIKNKQTKKINKKRKKANTTHLKNEKNVFFQLKLNSR